MSEKAEDAARHILDVDVKEVSLVDRAANLRQFLVVKRLEEDEMGAFASEERRESMKTEDIRKAEGKEMTEEEKEKLEAEKEKKKKQEEKEADEKEAAEKDAKMKAEAEKEEKTEKGMKPAAVAGMLRKLEGAPKGPVSELISWLENKTKAEDMDEEEKEKEEKAQKNLDGVQVAIMDDGEVRVSGQPVLKSKKFTPARMAAMKEMAMQLMKLIGDVDSETAKDIVDAMKEMPEGKTVQTAVRPVGTNKSVESEVVKQLREQNVKLEKRIEEIEKVRMPSKSVDSDGGTDKKTVKKSMWNGVL